MNSRERYIQSLTFNNPDKVYFSPGVPRESTLERWRREGLPEGFDYYQVLCKTLGFEAPQNKHVVNPGISFKMIPQFEEEVLEHKNGHYIVRDWMGAVVEISDRYDYTYLRYAKDFVTRRWLKFPVENHQDWAEMKKRYDPATPGRFAGDFREICRKLKDRDLPVTVNFSGPFWQLRDWCGFENLCIMMIEEPEFVEEMSAFWANFVAAMLDLVLAEITPDRVFINEDMAYKEHSMISPRMVYRFLMPAYQQWIPKLKKKGCPILEMDSDGYIGELIPLWIEAGFNCCSPVEVAGRE